MALDEAKRRSIVAMIEEGTGRNEVARSVGVAASTVSSVAKQAGLTFDRQQTAVASVAQASDAKARRQALGARMLGDLEEARLRLAKEPQARGFQAAAQGLDALARAYGNIAKIDGPDTTEQDQAVSMLGRLQIDLQAVVASSGWGPSGPDSSPSDPPIVGEPT
ncbi:hypothetical protein [Curtobacterium sp. NPDC089991]|uniref:hypothetical protein n=1 Tax=Curtobacterium sp. NPDC089991 TaxID=3363969 RepID=UPI00382706C4